MVADLFIQLLGVYKKKGLFFGDRQIGEEDRVAGHIIAPKV